MSRMQIQEQETSASNAPLPIWMAALLAGACQVLGRDGSRTVEWQCVSDQAIYTNFGDDLETLLPFNVPVRSGQTVVVTWTPGSSGYTVRSLDTAYLAV